MRSKASRYHSARARLCKWTDAAYAGALAGIPATDAQARDLGLIAWSAVSGRVAT